MSTYSPGVNARLASAVPLALMAEQDLRESAYLRNDIVAALENVVHPRYVARFKPTLGFVSSLLYYIIPLLSSSRGTPGQDFCGLDMVVQAADGATHGHGVFTKPTPSRYAMTALLMALLPCMGEIWQASGTVIVASVRELVMAMRANDGDASTSSEQVQEQEQEETTVGEEGGVGGLLLKFSRAVTAIGNRLLATIHSASVEACAQLNTDDHPDATAVGIRATATLLLDVHHLAYILNGLYFSFSLRLTGTKLMQRIKTVPRTGGNTTKDISLRVLRWVLWLRLTLLAGNGLALLVKHWRRNGESGMRRRDMASRLVAKQGTTATARELGETAMLRVSGMEGHLCPLCMGPVENPAATPCGHVYCWACIQSLCARVAPGCSLLATVSVAQSKCPVCRAEFAARQVRAIHT